MMNSNLSNLTALMVTYRSQNLRDSIIKTLKMFPNFVLVDNSVRKSFRIDQYVAKNLPQGIFPENKNNLGYGGGNNLGLTNVKTEYALIINPDLELSRNAVEAMLNTARANPSAVIVGARVYDTRLNQDQVSYGWHYPDNINAEYVIPDGDLSCYWLSGCCLLIRVKPFLDIGGFDEKFFMYYEEYDICQRVIQSGGDCVLSSAAVVKHHSQSSSSPSLRVEYLKTLHWNRSKQIFLNKYGYEKKSKIGRISRVVGYAVIGAIQLMAFQLNRAVKSFALAHAHIIFY